MCPFCKHEEPGKASTFCQEFNCESCEIYKNLKNPSPLDNHQKEIIQRELEKIENSIKIVKEVLK